MTVNRDDGAKPGRFAVFLFIDGLGWGVADPARNPCWGYGGDLLRLPPWPEQSVLVKTGGGQAAGYLSGGDLTGGDRLVPLPAGGWARPLDATLGVPGLPQSATGQTTLLTGVNAQGALGHHLTGFPNERLREILLAHSILKTVVAGGRKAAFLNAYRPRFFEFPREKQLHFSATTVANLAADLPFFTLDDLREGRAIYQEFTNRELRERGFEVPSRTPAEAGRLLGREAKRRHFTLFEYFQTDRAGHAQDRQWAHRELRGLEEFILSLLDELGLDGEGSARPGYQGEGPLLVVTSDHGNLEDLSTRSHTRNPVPLLAWGRGAASVAAGTADLTGVAPAIVRWLHEKAD